MFDSDLNLYIDYSGFANSPLNTIVFLLVVRVVETTFVVGCSPNLSTTACFLKSSLFPIIIVVVVVVGVVVAAATAAAAAAIVAPAAAAVVVVVVV